MNETHAERGLKWLTELLHLAGFQSSVSVNPNPSFAEDSDWLSIADSDLSSEQLQILLGDRGEVLDSIQYLANTTLNIGLEADQQGAYTVDLAGYRAERYEELKQIAEKAVERVRASGDEVELESLSSAERRQVHTLLKEYSDLETTSRGQEPNRRLVVRPLVDSE